MHILHYKDLMARAVRTGDVKTLDKLAQRLVDGEDALELLRAKGYGAAGNSLPATVRHVPDNPKKDVP